MTRERRLGRGLAALLGSPLSESNINDDVSFQEVSADPGPEAKSVAAEHIEPTDSSSNETIRNIPAKESDLVSLNVYEIDDNPFQPRRDFGESEIASLCESLKEHDMLQPILVRRVGERFQLISGERRLRAAIQAGWSTVPARIREANDRLVAELAIVENLQRKDLNAIEKALSFKRYIDQHQCSQDDLAGRLKINRSTIANLMRLLELPLAVQSAIQRSTITAGHARALLPLEDETQQMLFSDRIRSEGLSVREVERQVQEQLQEKETDSPGVVLPIDRKAKPFRSEQIASLEQELRRSLGTKVDIKQTSRGRGKIVIPFKSHEEFERLHAFLCDQAASKDLKSRAG